MAGGLSMIYAWSMADMCDHFVGSVCYGSTITKTKTIKRQTRAAWVWPQGQSPVGAGLSLQPIGCKCTPALSMTKSAAAAAVCGLWRYVSDGPLPLTWLRGFNSILMTSLHPLQLTINCNTFSIFKVFTCNFLRYLFIWQIGKNIRVFN